MELLTSRRVSSARKTERFATLGFVPRSISASTRLVDAAPPWLHVYTSSPSIVRLPAAVILGVAPPLLIGWAELGSFAT